jgi:UrcA family protein
MRISYAGMGSIVAAAFFGTADAATIARDMDQPPKAVVSIHDLDLSTNAGIRTARARIRRAAERVCGDYPRVGALVPADVQRCRTAAAREADARLAPFRLAAK